jgi:peroxiredoxin
MEKLLQKAGLVTTIAEKAAAVSAGAAAHVPAEIFAVFAGELSDLAAAGLPPNVAKTGTALPEAKLLDVHGASVSLADALGGHPAVVVLYRGDWCPFCNLTLRTYQEELLPTLEHMGVKLIAISPQKPDGALSMKEKNDLAYTVLSDPGNQIALALGVLTHPSDAVRAVQAQMGENIAAGNADATDGLPMPTTVVLDAAGTIRWIDVHPAFDTRSEVSDVLDAVAAL